METRHLPSRYITAALQQWPQTFKYSQSPISIGTYGHRLPFSLEDTMFVFDQLCRLNPLGIHFFSLAPLTQKKRLAQNQHPHQLTDHFFCTYLARYLNIPFYFFEIFFIDPASKKGARLELTSCINSSKLKHFSLYLDKTRKPNQEQVKQWIRKAYP